MLCQHYCFGSQENPPLVILHGLLGAADNWRTLAKRFSENFFVITADARNHGASFHHPNMTYRQMAEDVKHLLDELNLNKVSLIGHSMGGKTTMQFMNDYPSMVKQAVIVDIAPKAYDHHHQSMLSFLSRLNLAEHSSRTTIDEVLQAEINSPMVRNFVLKNLKRSENGFEWKLNLPAILNAYPDIMANLELNESSVPTLFIAGDKSTYIQDSDYSVIKKTYKDVKIEVCPNAGHWVQAENPEAFYNIAMGFLTK